MNQGLVKGAAQVGQSQISNWAESMQQGLNSGFQAAAINRSKQLAKKQRINEKVRGYIDNLNSNVDLTQLAPENQGAITNFLVKNRNIYAKAATEIAKIDDATDPRYMELRDIMNGVQNSFKNLAGQVGTFKEDKANYLKDFDARRISDGNEIGSLAGASKIYTDQGTMGVGEGGILNFWDEDKEEFTSYANVQKPFLKDFTAANSILKLNESVYSAGASLIGARQNMIRNKLKSMISSGGRDTLLSLASDDFLIDGGLNLEDDSLFEPANQDLLQDAVINSYMDALTDTAAQGARDKNSTSGKGNGIKSSALQDEIKVSGHIAEDALKFSNISQMPAGNERTSLALRFINGMDPTAKARPYISREAMLVEFKKSEEYDNDELEEAKEHFNSTYSDSPIFKYNPSDPLESVGIHIDISNPKALYKFYLQNSNLSGKAINYYLSTGDLISKGNQKVSKDNQKSSGRGSMSKYNKI